MYQPLPSSPPPLSKSSSLKGGGCGGGGGCGDDCEDTSSVDHHFHHYPHHHHLHHHHHNQFNSATNQRRTMLTLMILLVAAATLLTIIRLTLSPGLSVPNNSSPMPAATLHSMIRTIYNSGPVKIADTNRFKQINLVNNPQLSSSISKKKLELNSSEDNSGNLNLIPESESKQINSNNKENDENGAPESQSSTNLDSAGAGAVGVGSSNNNKNKNMAPSAPSTNPAITSLTADQRFEKEYRDELVQPTVNSSSSSSSSSVNSGTSKNQTNSKTRVQPAERKPKLIFDPSDLDQTRSLKIDKKQGCGEGNGAYADLVVIVNSAVSNFEARLAIRETWGKFAVERGALLYFMLGSTDDRKVQQHVEQEDHIYEDILQGRFYDNYYNLTLKTIAMMGWVSQRCSKIRYVLKVDDDMLLNMQHIADFAEINPNFHRVIIGKLAKKWRPHRDPRNKWYVPRRAFDGIFFPNFVTGPAYFFTGDAAKPLFDVAINDPNALFLEDVYMTGIVAERAGIKRFNHALMRNVHLKVDQCTYGKMMTSHKHSPDDIRRIWKLVYSGKKCEIKPPPPAAAPSAVSSSKQTNNNNNKSSKS